MHRREAYGPVTALHMGRPFLGGRPLMTVRCYVVDGLLVDAGLTAFREDVLAFAREHGAARCFVTHHHEDHSGNAAALASAGMAVVGGRATGDRIARGFSLRLYEKIAWGPAPRTSLGEAGPVLETGRHRFEVLAAPGHCDDQSVLYERGEGWLFSGDAFLGERIKYFRGDEDFHATVASLRRLVELPFERLFCAHRPVTQGGRAALARKLAHLEDLEGRVRELAAKGHSVARIARATLGAESPLLYVLSAGDVSKRNLVRAILHGPRPRPDA